MRKSTITTSLKPPQLSLKGFDILVLSPTPTYRVDQGNRKRIHSVCQQFRYRGARIHFLHYAQEWFTKIPYDSIKEMSQQWDSFHIVPPTRPLQAQAQGKHHTIDEWWDDAIGDYLKWLFEHNYFDVFIVNYTYLSKAFEFAPEHTYCILDTHDKFTGRRELFEEQGLNPEFFYTTQDQEAIALERASLVWSIKEEEALFFRDIATTPVCTMPHIEPQRQIQRALIPADEDFLVLGMIGARNNINIANARTFVEQVLPRFRECLAPIKIKFAGGMCSELSDLEEVAGVELMGRVETVEEFYAAIDIAIIPLAFSTGLKIKAVEAIASGLPVIAHQHALEGIPTTHPYQTCASLEEVAQSCLEVAFNRSLLVDLVEATQLTYQKICQQIELAMDYSVSSILKERPLIVIVLNEQFFDHWSPHREHTIHTIHFLKHLGNLVYYVDTTLDTKRLSAFEYHDGFGKIVLSPDAAKASGLIDAKGKELKSLGISYGVSTLEELCLTRQVLCLWLLDIPNELRYTISPALQEVPVYAQGDVIKSLTQDSNNYVLEPLKAFSNLTLINSSLLALSQHKHVFPEAKIAILPYWRELPWQIKDRESQQNIVILAHPSLLSSAYALWSVLSDLFPDEYCPVVFIAKSSEVNDEVDLGEFLKDTRFITYTGSPTELVRDFEVLGRYPRFVIDLSGEHLDFAIYRETLKRAKVPIITPDIVCTSSSNNFVQEINPLKPVSLSNCVEIITKLTMNDHYLQEIREKIELQNTVEYGNDAGWAKIWRELSEMRKNIDEQDI